MPSLGQHGYELFEAVGAYLDKLGRSEMPPLSKDQRRALRWVRGDRERLPYTPNSVTIHRLEAADVCEWNGEQWVLTGLGKRVLDRWGDR